MRIRTYLAICLTLLIARCSHAGNTRLCFDNGPSPVAASGSLVLKVGADPFARQRWMQYGIRIDGRLAATTASLPWSYTWSLSGVSQGEHEVRLLLIDTRTEAEVATDVLTVRVSAHAAPQPAPRVAPAAPKGAAKPAPTPAQHTATTAAKPLPAPRATQVAAARPAPHGPVQHAGSPDERDPGFRDPIPSDTAAGSTGVVDDPEPISAADREATPTFAPYQAALSLQATTLFAQDGRLFAGLIGGGVAIHNPATGKTVTAKAPAGTARTRLVAAGDGMVWWLPAAGTTLYAYRERDGHVASYRLPDGLSADAINSMACWKGRLLLAGTELSVLDAATGRPARLPGLPEGGPGSRRGGTLLASANGEEALVARMYATGRTADASGGAPGGELEMWRAGGRKGWEPAGTASFGITLQPGPRVAVSPGRVAVVERGTVEWANTAAGGSSRIQPDIADEARAFGEVTATACSGTDVWWSRGAVVFHCRLENGAAEAYMPWNSSPASVRLMAADGNDLWLATDRGIRHIVRGAPNRENGYGGYVRVPLGSSTAGPVSDIDNQLAGAIMDWQGTPYVWGGASRRGTDCSGFVMGAFGDIGIPLPHGSSSLRSLDAGMLVRDELRYGDVLVYPGHCAIYTGNGFTAETVSKAVGMRSIWMRSSVVVRRFLDDRSRGQLASRHGRVRR